MHPWCVLPAAARGAMGCQAHSGAARGRAEERVKYFELGENQAWKDRGVGQLTIIRGSGQTYLVLRNATGKPMLNASLYKDMKVQVKSKALVMTLFDTISGDGSKSQITLFRPKSLPQALALKEVIDKQVTLL